MMDGNGHGRCTFLFQCEENENDVGNNVDQNGKILEIKEEKAIVVLLKIKDGENYPSIDTRIIYRIYIGDENFKKTSNLQTMDLFDNKKEKHSDLNHNLQKQDDTKNNCYRHEETNDKRKNTTQKEEKTDNDRTSLTESKTIRNHKLNHNNNTKIDMSHKSRINNEIVVGKAIHLKKQLNPFNNILNFKTNNYSYTKNKQIDFGGSFYQLLFDQ